MTGKEFVFTSCEDPREIWAAILEKAYAKKYGSYSVIEGGFVHLALSELTNGIPEYVELTRDTNQLQVWNSTLALHKEGTLLGAGSPSHPEGDSAKSKTGIVQGHAYSVLKLIEVDKVKLICVRNPWGQGEWTGDWSDSSDLWTPRMKNLCGFSDLVEDGIFWMDFSDFCNEFSEIYVCRTYSESPQWECILLEDKWEGSYASGYPIAKNKQAGSKLELLPQFSITVDRPGKGYIVLRLKEKSSPYKSIQAGFLTLQSNDGKVITDKIGLRKSTTIVNIGPQKHPLLSEEIEFPSTLSYPYTFTCLVTNKENGEAGFGNFSVQVFSKSKLKANKLN